MKKFIAVFVAMLVLVFVAGAQTKTTYKTAKFNKANTKKQIIAVAQSQKLKAPVQSNSKVDAKKEGE